MTTTRQLRLDLTRGPSFGRDNFIVSSSNSAAVRSVDAWPNWPGGLLALVGPAGCGKTHLGRAWALRANAVHLEPSEDDLTDLRGRAVLIEDADQGGLGDNLFHAINMANLGGTLLLTGRSPPQAWPSTIPDLRSRLRALPVATIGPPDDIVLTGVLKSFFGERNIRLDDEVLSYLIYRIERSVPDAMDVVRRIDECAAATGREITRALAKHVLEQSNKSLDLFE